ncbi:MAG: hypothetical protein AB1609_11610 [Bacillota bacterium]
MVRAQGWRKAAARPVGWRGVIGGGGMAMARPRWNWKEVAGVSHENTVEVGERPAPAASAGLLLRDAKGRFAKGSKPPNPRGRPKAEGEVRAAAQAHGLEAIERLLYLMFHGRPDRVQVAAAEALLDRAYGRRPQAVTVQGEVTEHRSFELTARLVAEHPELLDLLFAAAARRELAHAQAAGRRARVADVVQAAERDEAAESAPAASSS